MESQANRPIGIFDSGIGGLTVFREIRRALPQERIVYLGDTARVPYGSKSAATVIRYALEDSAFLVKHQVKMLIVACNTASAYSLKTIQDRFPLPTIGVVEPGAKAAVAITKGKIGVIGTEGTIDSKAYPEAIRRLNPSLSVFTRSCPLFVALVEEGWVDNEVTQKVTEYYLSDLRKDQIDTLVLGCTHYPLLKRTIRGVMGDEVRIIDSAEAVCAEVISVLEEKGLRKTGGPGEARIFVTDLPQRFERVGRLFLGGDLPPVSQVDLM